jgi:DNA-binding FrmR family transcriptional regulator
LQAVTISTHRNEYNKDNLHRIRRIKGQLEALERMIEADEGTCEERVIRARTVEKGVTSLINHLVACYLDNTAKDEMTTAPDKVVSDVKRILELLNK